jgi:hypothetical protein
MKQYFASIGKGQQQQRQHFDMNNDSITAA